jgi:hypothetical protein
MEGDNLEDQAFADAGIEVVDNSQESADKQEQQESLEGSNSENESESSDDETSSETQDTEEQKENESEENSENEDSSQEGEVSEKRSRVIDLSNDEDNEDSSETTESEGDEATFNFSEMLGEEFQTIDDVKDQLEHVSSLEAQIEELSGIEPGFANDFVKEMNDYVKNGGDPAFFAKVQSVDVDNLKPIDALKLELQWKDGLSGAEAEVLINQKYANEDFDEDSGEINPSAVQMKVDANRAKASLKEKQADNTLIEPKAGGISESELEERAVERQETIREENDFRMWDEQKGWAGAVDKAIDGIKNNGVVLDLGGGKGFEFVYDKDQAYTDNLIGQVDQALYDSNMSREDNPELAKNIAENIFFLENKREIMKAYGDEIRSMKNEEYHKLNHNPSSIGKGDKRETSNAPITEADVVEQLKGFD